MTNRSYLGELEHIVLLAVLRLSDEAYGVTIRDEVLDRTGRSISSGTIYPTLDRLEQKELVTSYMADPTPERGGRSRRMYQISKAGVAALRAQHEMLHAMGQGLEHILSKRGST